MSLTGSTTSATTALLAGLARATRPRTVTSESQTEAHDSSRDSMITMISRTVMITMITIAVRFSADLQPLFSKTLNFQKARSPSFDSKPQSCYLQTSACLSLP